MLGHFEVVLVCPNSAACRCVSMVCWQGVGGIGAKEVSPVLLRFLPRLLRKNTGIRTCKSRGRTCPWCRKQNSPTSYANFSVQIGQQGEMVSSGWLQLLSQQNAGAPSVFKGVNTRFLEKRLSPLTPAKEESPWRRLLCIQNLIIFPSQRQTWGPAEAQMGDGRGPPPHQELYIDRQSKVLHLSDPSRSFGKCEVCHAVAHIRPRGVAICLSLRTGC